MTWRLDKSPATFKLNDSQYASVAFLTAINARTFIGIPISFTDAPSSDVVQ